MRSCARIYVSVIFSVLFLSLAACGGGGGGAQTGTPETPSVPPSSPPPRETTVLTGNDQIALPGNILHEPIKIMASNGMNRRAGIAIDFAADTGVQVFPNPVITNSEGEARVLVRLPDVPNSTFTIKASTQGDPTPAIITARTGLRAVALVGDPTVGVARVRENGTLVASGSGGASVFWPDGSLRASSSPTSKRFTFPWDRSATLVRSWMPGRLVFDLGGDDLIIVTDYDLNITNLVDQRFVTSDMYLRGPVVGLSADGTLYVNAFKGVHAFKLDGQSKGIVPIPYLYDLAENGNLIGGPDVTEYRPDGAVVGNIPSPAAYQGFSIVRAAPGGGVLMGTGFEVFVYDSNRVLQKHLRSIPMIESLAGADATGNLYFVYDNNILKIDADGNRVSERTYSQGSHPGRLLVADDLRNRILALASSKTSSEFVVLDLANLTNTSTHAWIEQRWRGMSWDPSTGGFYVAIPPSLPTEPLKVNVYDASLAFNRSLTYTQFGDPMAIAIDRVGTKYIFDRSTDSIHVLDPQDAYVRSFAFESTPAEREWNRDTAMSFMHDGSLLVLRSGQGTKLTKLKTDGTKVWQKTLNAETASFAIDSADHIYLRQFGVLRALDTDGNPLASHVWITVGQGNAMTILSDNR